MPFVIPNNIITLTRGDSYTKEIEVSLQGCDAIYFGIMDPNQLFEDAIIRQKYTVKDIVDNKIKIKLYPEDTLNLIPGVYYYSIKLKLDHKEFGEKIEEVKTLIDRTKFIILD